LKERGNLATMSGNLNDPVRRVRRDSASLSSQASGDVEVPIKDLDHKHTDADRESPCSSDVRYEYLEFETALPAYATTHIHPDAPQPPNLRGYESPFSWSSSRKTVVLILCTFATFCAAYSAGSYSMAKDPLMAKWAVGTVAFNVGVTTWCLGFGIAPMFLAPFSEINGRKPVFVISCVVFVAAQIGCALTDSFAGMLVARFFVGGSASTFSTIIGGVLADIYHKEDRNTPMAVYSGGALAGTGMGPFLSGFIIGRASWRWVFYHQLFLDVILLCAMYFFLKETRGSVLLSRRAKALNKYFEALEKSEHFPQPTEKPTSDSYQATNLIRYRVLADEQRSSIQRMIYLSTTTPFKLLSTEPVVFFFSLWAAFAWATLYLTLPAIPLVFTARHNFDVQGNGCVFISLTVGAIIGALLSIYQEKAARKWWPHLLEQPEGRLYFACLESALLPIGLFWFGATTSSHIHWISPVIALGVAQVGIFSIYLAVFNYLADVYHRYASSALAGQSFCRNMGAAAFPLFTVQMFNGLGFLGASCLLGGVGALLTLVPWVLVFNGERIRRRSKIAREIMEGPG
jgi:multidrug resistance protein